MTPALISEDNTSSLIRENDYVMLYIDSKRRHIVKIESGKRFDSDRGVISHSEMIGRFYGSIVKTSLGAEVYLIRPTLEDLIYRIFRRPTQVLYPKDIGLIMIKLDAWEGKRFLEAGVGSGVSTAFLARSVAPTGRVYGYEIREDLARIALENLRRLNLDKYAEIKIRDVAEGVDERDLDGALIDLPDPWRVVDSVYNAIRESAPVVFFVPTVNQLNKLIDALLSDERWIDIEVYELLERKYEVKRNAVRPSARMIGHTGYIIRARKALKQR
ncbi:MAG: tRNA (adenine-N1)-methyltransferase [Sulfolobales archaeon]